MPLLISIAMWRFRSFGETLNSFGRSIGVRALGPSRRRAEPTGCIGMEPSRNRRAVADAQRLARIRRNV